MKSKKATHIPEEQIVTMPYLWQLYENTPRELAFHAQTLDEWREWRKALHNKLIELLGEFPTTRCHLDPQVVEVVEEKEYRREQVYFHAEPNVIVPCYVLIPHKVKPPYRPVIALHGHGSDGARLMLGLTRNAKERANLRELNYDYARQLAKHGFMVFAPVLRALGERMEKQRNQRTGVGVWAKSCDLATLASFMLGRTMTGMRVWDVMRTIDYIHSRPEPIADCVGCLGLSGGGSVTLYATAVDERISTAVIDAAFCTYRASIMSIRHCPDNYLPGILKYAEASDIAGLIAPRPLLIESGTRDPLFPIAGVQQAYEELSKVYAVADSSDKLDSDCFPGGHQFGGRKAFAWLDRWLVNET